jgi:hypothetical protein
VCVFNLSEKRKKNEKWKKWRTWTITPVSYYTRKKQRQSKHPRIEHILMLTPLRIHIYVFFTLFLISFIIIITIIIYIFFLFFVMYGTYIQDTIPRATLTFMHAYDFFCASSSFYDDTRIRDYCNTECYKYITGRHGPRFSYRLQRARARRTQTHIILFNFSLRQQRGCAPPYTGRSICVRVYKIGLYKLLRLRRKRATWKSSG